MDGPVLAIGEKAALILDMATKKQLEGALFRCDARREGDAVLVSFTMELPPLDEAMLRKAAENCVVISPVPAKEGAPDAHTEDAGGQS